MNKRLVLTLITLVLATLPQMAFAAAGGGSLPWEGPLQTIQASLTGPVAVSIALVAIAVAGAMLIFGGEINNFARMGVYITLVLGMLIMANNMLQGLYAPGATIPEHLANTQIQTSDITTDRVR